MVRDLGAARSPALPSAALVLVPVGSVEQHGPHLPLETDTIIAAAVARTAADLLVPSPGTSPVLLAPPVAYGASGEHQMFPGTSSIGTDALRILLVELTRSLRTWAERVCFVNGHGGNRDALVAAVGQLRDEGHRVDWFACATEEVDLHAGRTETSLLLHLRPDLVRRDLAVAGNTAPLAEILPTLMREGVAAVSPNGVLGDPAGASAEEGEAVLRMMARQVARAVRPDAPPAPLVEERAPGRASRDQVSRVVTSSQAPL